MANCATNIFHATTANKQDLDKIEAFLDDNFDGYINRYADIIDAEFSSRWYNRENETYNFLKRNVQFSLFFTPSKQRHLITI